jgi:hypothetical protein
MSIEKGVEAIRTCPRKEAEARVPQVVYSVPPSEFPSVTYVVPEGADVECDPKCPGAELVRRKLGPIPLPVFKEVCPMEGAGPNALRPPSSL